MVKIPATHKTFVRRHTYTISVAEFNLVESSLFFPNLTKPTYWFSRLNVPVRERNKGIAAELLTEAFAWAKEEDVTIVCIPNSYGDLNPRQLENFYLKHGFVKIDNILVFNK